MSIGGSRSGSQFSVHIKTLDLALAAAPVDGRVPSSILIVDLFSVFKESNMNFLNQLLRGIAFVPALVNGIEALFASKSGAEKKDAVMSFLESALATVDAISAREIVDPDKFRNGISKIIDG